MWDAESEMWDGDSIQISVYCDFAWPETTEYSISQTSHTALYAHEEAHVTASALPHI
jgi:hypothetical protein